MYIHRTRIGSDIVAEFTVPETPNGMVAIVATGMPTPPSKPGLLQFLAAQGFFVIHPHYRGTWESDGAFLKDEPTKDILDTITYCEEHKKLYSFWEEREHRLPKKPRYVIFAGSFGGPAGLLPSKHPKVAKVVCVAPVVDWRMESKAEPLPWLFTIVKNAYGNGFRVTKKDWEKLGAKNFYDPTRQPENIDGKKVIIFHAADDMSIPIETVTTFAQAHSITLYKKKAGGHLSLSLLSKAWYWKRVSAFLES